MKRLFFILSLLLTTAIVSAVPAMRGLWQTLKLADGTEVSAELCGDEYCHYWQDADGHTYFSLDDTGLYERADVSSRAAAARQARLTANKKRMGRLPMRVGTTGGSDYTGTKRGLIILVEFSDMSFSEGNTPELYKQIANEENFTSELGFVGSVSDYFKSQSNGVFDMKFDVLGPVRMPNRFGYYGQDYGGVGADRYPGKMIVSACQGVDDIVNFADYDWDGDGEVDQVFILYAGRGQASGGATNTIWPHEGYLSGWGGPGAFSLDGVKIDTYACSCELGKNGTIDGIGTICHEFSHCLGIPDMYDTANQTNYGMYTWDLMDMGNYLGDSFTPSGYTSYERIFCGWKQPVVLENDTVITDMKPLTEGGEAYLIYNDGHKDEFYLLENRQQVGWDKEQYGKGLLILHVDYDEEVWLSNAVNSGKVQHCTIFNADNSAVKTSASDVANDPFPYSANNSLTNTSTPSASLHNANTDGTKLMNKAVTDITQNADGTIAFRFTNNNGTDGIESVTGDAEDKASGAIYTVDGRYAGTDMSRLGQGLYVVKGKKVVK